MLSSVAIHAGDFKQGQGFFDLAEELYAITFHSEDAKLKFGMDEMNKNACILVKIVTVLKDFWVFHNLFRNCPRIMSYSGYHSCQS